MTSCRQFWLKQGPFEARTSHKHQLAPILNLCLMQGRPCRRNQQAQAQAQAHAQALVHNASCLTAPTECSRMQSLAAAHLAGAAWGSLRQQSRRGMIVRLQSTISLPSSVHRRPLCQTERQQLQHKRRCNSSSCNTSWGLAAQRRRAHQQNQHSCTAWSHNGHRPCPCSCQLISEEL